MGILTPNEPIDDGWHFAISSRPGVISKQLMRHYFEGSVNGTASLKASVSLEPILVAGEFSRYRSLETEKMWFGFAFGMRCAERIQREIERLALERPSPTHVDEYAAQQSPRARSRSASVERSPTDSP